MKKKRDNSIPTREERIKQLRQIGQIQTFTIYYSLKQKDSNNQFIYYGKTLYTQTLILQNEQKNDEFWNEKLKQKQIQLEKAEKLIKKLNFQKNQALAYIKFQDELIRQGQNIQMQMQIKNAQFLKKKKDKQLQQIYIQKFHQINNKMVANVNQTISLNNKVKSISDQLKELKNQRQAWRLQLKKKMDQMNKDLKQNQHKINELRNIGSETQNQINLLSQQLNAEKKKIQDLQERFAKSEIQTKQLKDLLNQCLTDKKKMQKQFKNFQNKMKEKFRILTLQIKNIFRACQTIFSLVNEIEELRILLRNQQKKFQNAFKSLLTDRKIVLDQIQKLTFSANVKQIELSHQLKKAELQSQIKLLMEKNENIQNLRQQLQSDE